MSAAHHSHAGIMPRPAIIEESCLMSTEEAGNDWSTDNTGSPLKTFIQRRSERLHNTLKTVALTSYKPQFL